MFTFVKHLRKHDMTAKDAIKSELLDKRRDYLLPQGEYLYTLNRFLAWYYFRVKNPDTYMKTMETRYFNKLMQ